MIDLTGYDVDFPRESTKKAFEVYLENEFWKSEIDQAPSKAVRNYYALEYESSWLSDDDANDLIDTVREEMKRCIWECMDYSDYQYLIIHNRHCALASRMNIFYNIVPALLNRFPDKACDYYHR